MIHISMSESGIAVCFFEKVIMYQLIFLLIYVLQKEEMLENRMRRRKYIC